MANLITTLRSNTTKQANIAEQIAAELREEIACGTWTVGQYLPAEHQLMERFGVSRPSCREALRILQSEGLVEVQRGNRGGAKVMPPNAKRIASYARVFLQMRSTTIIEVFETRIVIEPAAVASFAQTDCRDTLPLLAQIAASQRYLIHDRPAYYQKARDFRELIIEHCGSESLRLIGLVIGDIADRQLSSLSVRLQHDDKEVDRLIESVVLKEKLLEAAARGQAEEAAECWRDYLTIHLNFMREILPPNAFDLQSSAMV